MFLFDLFFLWGVNNLAKHSGVECDKDTVIFDSFNHGLEPSHEVPYYSNDGGEQHDVDDFLEGEW